MSDLHGRVQQELSEKKPTSAKKRDSKILPFLLIMVVVFGLMFAFLYYSNQNVEPAGTTSNTPSSTK